MQANVEKCFFAKFLLNSSLCTSKIGFAYLCNYWYQYTRPTASCYNLHINPRTPKVIYNVADQGGGFLGPPFPFPYRITDFHEILHTDRTRRVLHDDVNIKRVNHKGSKFQKVFQKTSRIFIYFQQLLKFL